MKVGNHELWRMDSKVLDWMKDNVPSTAVVLELGGGAGSIDLHKHWTGWTVEHDFQWYQWLERKGVPAIYSPLRDGWYGLAPRTVRKLQTADVVIIDGPPSTLRPNAAHHLHHIKEGAIVVYDDAHRSRVRKMVVGEVLATIKCDHGRRSIIAKHPCLTAPSNNVAAHG